MKKRYLFSSVANVDSQVKVFLNFLQGMDYAFYNVDTKQRSDNFDDFYECYRLQFPQQTIERNYGVCSDFVELERLMFAGRGIPFAVFYIELEKESENPAHSFLVYKDGNKFCWFEYSWGDYEGIHKYDSLEKLLQDVCKKHQKQYKDEKSNVVLTQYKKPDYGITCEQLMMFCRKGFDCSSMLEN